MLYIKKSNPSKKAADEISRVQREQKSLIDRGTTDSVREAFNYLNKSLIRESLIAEQHGLCAYCMRRINNDTNMTIEHWHSIESEPAGALDYRNMLGVCDGGRKIDRADSDENRHVLCCDASKGNREIIINPCNSDHMRKFRYSEDGRVYTYPKDEVLEKDINEVLHLNGENGFDTSTRLLWCRREAYRAYERFIDGLSKTNKLSRSVIEKRIHYIESQDRYDEFAGVVLYFLKRKLRQL